MEDSSFPRSVFRRRIVGAAVAIVAAGTLSHIGPGGRAHAIEVQSGHHVQNVAAADPATAIRPFHAHVPDAQLADLRKRIAATRWPDKETVADGSQGAQLDQLRALIHYWGTDYDWRK